MNVVRGAVPAGVPQPHRRDHPVPPAAAGGYGRDRRYPAQAAGEAARRPQDHARPRPRRRVDWLAAKGYDPAYGARPLKRVMQKELQDPLAERLLWRDPRRLDRQGDGRRLRPRHRRQVGASTCRAAAAANGGERVTPSPTLPDAQTGCSRFAQRRRSRQQPTSDGRGSRARPLLS